MKNTRAFTLIEVMVVLSILAIIAILAYNFFGSTMREAAIKQQATNLRKQIQTMENAFLEYVRKTGDIRPSNPTFDSEVISLGILKEIPKPDLAIKTDPADSACPIANAPGGTRGWTLYYFDFYGGSGEEVMTHIYCVNDEVCKAYNEMYTTLGATIPAKNSFITEMQNAGGSLCEPGSSDPDNNNLVISLIEVK